MSKTELQFRTHDDDDITVESFPSCCVITVDQGSKTFMFELTPDEASTFAAALLRTRYYA